MTLHACIHTHTKKTTIKIQPNIKYSYLQENKAHEMNSGGSKQFTAGRVMKVVNEVVVLRQSSESRAPINKTTKPRQLSFDV